MYVARSDPVPEGKSRVVIVACPEAFTRVVPIRVVPKLKVTLPVAPTGVTVAVSVTGWLRVDGFGLARTAVVVGSKLGHLQIAVRH